MNKCVCLKDGCGWCESSSSVSCRSIRLRLMKVNGDSRCQKLQIACVNVKRRATHIHFCFSPANNAYHLLGPADDATAFGSTETAAEEGLPSVASPRSFSNYLKAL